MLDAIGNWLNRSEFANAGGSEARSIEWIGLGEDMIARDPRIRVREMEHTTPVILKKSLDGKTSSGANTILLTPDTAETEHILGDSWFFEAGASNTGNTTVNISSVGANSLLDEDGSTELEANSIVLGGSYHIYYDGTNWRLLPRGSAPLPSRFLGARNMFIDGDPVRIIEYLAPRQFWQTKAAGTVGKPAAYTITGDRFVFGPAPSEDLELKCNYYRRNANTAIDSDTNWIIDNVPMLLLSASLLEAAMFLDDNSSILKWAARYDDLAEKIKQANKIDRFNGAPIVSQTDVIIEGSRAAGSRRQRT
tara:strand:- start:927 stop:1847 length:921 start_codon:yes stop_codon:yes gene_type:complete